MTKRVAGPLKAALAKEHPDLPEELPVDRDPPSELEALEVAPSTGDVTGPDASTDVPGPVGTAGLPSGVALCGGEAASVPSGRQRTQGSVTLRGGVPWE
jgi:hypothetical protein